MRRWTQLFKLLGNISRLRIIKLLSDKKERTVSDIAKVIHVSFKGTSKHLIQLSNFDIIKSEGKAGHVYYAINGSMPSDARRAIDVFFKDQ